MKLSSGYPLSLIKNGLLFSYPKLERDIKTEVLVLGGGISGALAAHYLIQEGIECTLIDARTIGLGSTCASTSLLQYEIDTPLHQLIKMVGKKMLFVHINSAFSNNKACSTCSKNRDERF
jgi:heterodisulfide reductase subunit A-like polyferredoxin